MQNYCENSLKKNQAYQPKSFEKAYEKIRVLSNGCYISTYCFGDQHQNTKLLRQFKKFLLNYQIGHIFVDYYYRISPRLVIYCENNPVFGKIVSRLIFIPILKLFSKVIRKFII